MQTVLIGDDELNIRSIVEFTLGAEGYRVLAASDGQAAFDLAVQERPDLIILDVMMPRGDGFTICRRLKEDPRTADIPVILLTACSSRTDRRHGQKVLADDFMTKPFSPHSLITRIQSLLGVRKG